MSEKGKFSFAFFMFILLIFIVGGYFLTDYMLKSDFSKVKENEDIVTEITDYRIDKTKGYVYFTDSTLLITGSGIARQNIVINLENFEYLSNELNSEEALFDEKTTYVKDLDLDESSLILNNEGIYSLVYRLYSVIEYDKYVIIIFEDYEYDIVNITNAINMGVYVIDKDYNFLVDDKSILSDFEVTNEEIVAQIKNVLEAEYYNGEDIDVANTLDNLEYEVYYNNVGNLEILYKVVSTNGNYYDTLVFN